MFTVRIERARLHMAIELVEQEFGKKWLSRKALQLNSKHPVPRAWREAISVGQAPQAGQPVSVRVEQVAPILELGRILERVSPLANYAIAIRPRLKDPDFAHVYYEMQVAACAVEGGYGVEFVPTSSAPGVKTADLRVSTPSSTYHVECKRKEAYRIATVEEGTWPSLQKRITSLLDELKVNYEVIIVAMGAFSEGDDMEILKGIREAVARGFEGGPLTRRGASHALYLRKLTLPPPGPDAMIPLWPRKSRDGEVHADVYRSTDDLLHITSMRGAWLYTVDSHKLGSIVQSFNAARSQLPAGESGVIYIDLDVSEVEDDDVRLYLEAASAALRCVFSPETNTRVAGVVLTAQPRPTLAAWNPEMHFMITVNKFHPLSGSIKFPPQPIGVPG